ncbi:MAG: hypothetical protein ABR569_01765 [Gaiellaceae bacterium]
MHKYVLRIGLGFAALLCLLLPLSAAQAAFPGGNGLIAYACGPNVCQIDPISGGPTRTVLVPNASDPAWSPDGSQIAYVTSSGIHVADVSGRALSNDLLLASTTGATQPAWSPDGSQIAYVSGQDIWTVNSDNTGGAANLTNGTAADDADPAWSVNGEIAFASGTGGNHDIWVMNSDGSRQTRLTTASTDERHPNWSPDGGTIVFVSGGQTLTTVSESGGAPTTLGVSGNEPAYSPDGSKIAYVDASGKLRTINANGASSSDVTLDTGSNADPDWQWITPPATGGSGAPVNTDLPTIFLPFGSTAPTVGQGVSTSIGSWTGAFPITYTYQWKKCDVKTTSCYTIPDATFSFFTPTPDEYGWQLRVEITATNSVGSTSQNSLPTPAVTALAPHLMDTPPIIGDNVENQTLTVSSGNWSGSLPLAFTYEWRRCDAFGTLPSCVAIPGATDTSYTLTTADIDFTIRVFITGKNFVGSETDFTNHTFPTLPRPRFPPSSTVQPVVTGTPRLGSRLVAVAGFWDGEPPITTVYRWQRCDATGSSCVDVPARTKLFYVLTAADLGSTIRLVATAQNTIGTTEALTDPTDPVASVPAALLHGKRIAGTARADYIAGGGGNDVLRGLDGNDTIRGGEGDDRLEGGPGNDILDGGPGVDVINAGPGSDTVLAADGAVDTIDCGPGNDRAVVDAFDKVKNCEVVVTASGQSSGTGQSSDPGQSSGTGLSPGSR